MTTGLKDSLLDSTFLEPITLVDYMNQHVSNNKTLNGKSFYGHGVYHDHVLNFYFISITLSHLICNEICHWY